ncbi:Ras-related protein Rab-28 [Hondaea fermentalgiana]|uniref:Ras-related protein Rab-28 n=1 Tax=Hondaea fermentalgiana TaxID=2315210 RepID=A0A2R5GAN9_9STRA|nr:Ras-related protein Rab-28 [Hondaea fermentalgiana]|eukprot:GBG25613.1 Ras-related protein Rab-28 [Hondaea fermentalgiana]
MGPSLIRRDSALALGRHGALTKRLSAGNMLGHVQGAGNDHASPATAKSIVSRSDGEEKASLDSGDEEEPTQMQFKVILLGDGSVGKTSTATRFTQGHFKRTYKQTIGLDFFIKRLVLPGEINVALQIWDIGGQSIGSKMISNYIYGADAIVLMYDITNYQSFRNLEDWMRLVRKVFSEGPMPHVALVANKCDLEHVRTVTKEKHNDFADENEFYSYSLSAKSGDNVRGTFHRLAADLAGVTLTRPEFQVAHQVVKAEIIDHEKDDPEVNAPSYASGSKSHCIIS